jgi:GNAT superfamily N-acetyltransferase
VDDVRVTPCTDAALIAALHVLPAEWGRGIGSALHDAALTVLSRAGHRSAGLWVIAANQRARRMYEQRGWVLRPGVEQLSYGVPDVRYRRPLP